MTDPLSIGLASAAAVVALVAGWVQWPRPPELDGERWFKLMLATLLRGEIEARGEEADAWEAAVLRFVPYHPAGRSPERKVRNPAAAQLPGARLPHEQALVEALVARDSVQARWAWMYDEDRVGVEARLDDPVELGPAYSPVNVLGADGDWEALASWGGGDPGFLRAIRRRVRARWVLIGGAREVGPGMLRPLAEAVGEVEWIPWEPDAWWEEAIESLGVQLQELLTRREDRLIMVGEGEGVALLLRTLQRRADLRDQVDAVLSIGGVIGGWPEEEGPLGARDCADWLAAHFTHEALDTEVVRLTPYLSVQWLDRTDPVLGAGGLPLAAQRFPAIPSGALEMVEPVDLGPLPADPELPRELVARGLVAMVSCWLLTRR